MDEGQVGAIDRERVRGVLEVVGDQDGLTALAAEDVDLLAGGLPTAAPVGIGQGALV